MVRRSIFILLAMVLRIGTSADGQEIGYAYFALMSEKFPCEAALRSFKESPATGLSILWDTFGRSGSCLRQWQETVSDRKVFLQIHLTNEACRRNRRCEQLEFFPKLSVAEFNRRLEADDPELIEAIKERTRDITAFVSPMSHSSSELVLSTGLEDNYTDRAYLSIFAAVREYWPYKIARSPVKPAPASVIGDADYLEFHGDVPPPVSRPCIMNLDRQDIEFPHRPASTTKRISWGELSTYIKKSRANCRMTFLWAAPWQGIHSNRFTSPSTRSFSVSAEDISALTGLLNDN